MFRKFYRTSNLIIQYLILTVILVNCASTSKAVKTSPSDPTQLYTSIVPTTYPSIPPSATSFATLRPQEKDAYLLDLISTNADCKLPCILGIRPGNSTWGDFIGLASPINANTSIDIEGDFRKASFSHSFIYKNASLIELTAQGSEEKIDQISISAYFLLPDDPYFYPPFNHAWRRFSLKTLLEKHGVPSRVRLHVQGVAEPGGGSRIEIIVLYEQFDFVVVYKFGGGVIEDTASDQMQICPMFDNLSLIRIFSKASSVERTLNSLAGTTKVSFGWYWDWEYLTGLSIEEFHAIFSADDETSCVMLVN